MGRLRKIQRINAANNMLVRRQVETGGRPRGCWEELHAVMVETAGNGGLGPCLAPLLQVRLAAAGWLLGVYARMRTHAMPILHRPWWAPLRSNVQVRVPPSMGHLTTIKELNLRWAARRLAAIGWVAA
jgi:hypothetical protein